MPADSLAALDAIAPEDVPEALGRLLARLVAAGGRRDVPDAGADLIDADATAALLGKPRRWVWDHAGELGGKRVSPRRLVFSRRKVLRWLDGRGVYARA